MRKAIQKILSLRGPFSYSKLRKLPFWSENKEETKMKEKEEKADEERKEKEQNENE